ncbi:MAG: hypothetical protein H0W62_05900 [Chitinophagales bacterium]|nr:hypothetical protein [Chitinophagales bacterium]
MAHLYDISDMKFYAQALGGKCLSQEYVNPTTALTWRCENGHVFLRTFEIVRQGGWCSQCAKDEWKQEKLQYLKAVAESRGGTCLSNRYITFTTKLHFKCERGHYWSTTPKQIQKGRWCKRCADRVAADKRRTDIKVYQEIARQRGGKLLSSVFVTNDTKITWQCEDGHIWDAIPIAVKRGTWCPYCAGRHNHSIAEMQRVAKDRGGVCLSLKYSRAHTPLKWQCRNGHTWEAKPVNIIFNQSWCPYCAGKKKHTIHDMQDLAKKRGGLCLSSTYTNNKTKLRWKCEQNHEWLAKPNAIINGRWCPRCAPVRRWKTRRSAEKGISM